MSNQGHETILSAVREQYEAFPYPPIETIGQEDLERNLRTSFNVEFGLGDDRELKPGSKIWVPGCGTRWATMLALQFSDVKIFATDLSDRNLQKQSDLARSLGVENIEFRREDLLKGNYDNEFDFISCVGVLHHLPDPSEGFAVISRALKRTGLAEIMVYDRMNRRYSIRMREIVETLDPQSKLNAEARFDLAVKVLRSLNRHASAPRELKRILGHLDNDANFRNELADFVSHPQEHYFDVPSLLRSLRNVNLRPRTWRPPYRFDPKFMLSDSDLCAQVDEMEADRSAHLAHLLGAGLLEVFVEHIDKTVVPKSKVATRVVRSITVGALHRVTDTGCVKTEPQSKLFQSKDGLMFDAGQRRPAVAAYGIDLDCIKPGQRRLLKISDLGFKTTLFDEHIEAIAEAAAKPMRIADIVAAVLKNRSLTPVSGAEVEKVCDHLCRTPYRILATVSE